MADATTSWTLRSGPYEAAVDAVGATLRRLAHAGHDLVVPFPEGTVRPMYRGAIVAPWPNRVVAGRYRFEGDDFQLALTEPERGHALHGLVNWVRWQGVEAGEDRLLLRHHLVPQAGYPFALALEVEYTLTGAGLTTRLTAHNTGTRNAPYGCCPHPYLVAGPGRVDDWLLTLPADRVLETTELLVPTGLRPAAELGFDFDRRRIGELGIDHAFTGLHRDRDGGATVRVEAADTGVELSWGAWAPWVQVHTADRPEPENDRVGLAVEPMSCPPDAFNSGTDLVVLAPGQAHEAGWTIRGW